MTRPHLLPIFASLAVVLAAYWSYARLVVGLIEPEAAAREIGRVSVISDPPPDPLGGLKQHFRPGDWELAEPCILSGRQAMLLFVDYAKRGDKRVELRPCTMIFMSDEPGLSPAENEHRAVIVQAPEGALLDFDRPLDLRQMNIGRLVGGRLNGLVVIRSQGKLPGPEDDLWIETRDVSLSEQEVTTRQAVHFRWGTSHGSGRGLTIKLRAEKHKAPEHGPNVAGIEYLELQSIDRFCLESAKKNVRRARMPAVKGEKDASEVPVEITCHGSFCFVPEEDPEKESEASFWDEVDVSRHHPDGPSDHLHCDVLFVYFGPKEKAKASARAQKDGSAGQTEGLVDLEPRWIKAVGSPVIVRVPSQSLEARGRQLEYHLRSGPKLPDGGEDVILRHRPNEVHAASLEYRPSGAGRLGQVGAPGPEWPVVWSTERLEEQLPGCRAQQQQVLPPERNQVIILTGGAELSFRGTERLLAEEIHFWLKDKPGTSGSSHNEMMPDRMIALRNVRIHHPQIDGAFNQLDVRFVDVPSRPSQPDSQEAGAPVGKVGPTCGTSNWVWRIFAPPPRDVCRTAQGTVRTMPLTVAEQNVAPVPVSSGPTPAAPSRAGHGRPARVQPEALAVSSTPGAPACGQRFNIVGDLAQAQVLLQSEKATLSQLVVEGNARLVEEETVTLGERPMLVTGDRIQVAGASEPCCELVTVTGCPAHFEARGLALNGSNINLNRGTNRLWIDGPGWMELPMDREPQGRPVRDAGPLEIHWQQRMDLVKGQTALFEDSVVATSRFHHLRTETLEVSLHPPIDFSKSKMDTRPQVQRLVCRGGAYLENRTRDEGGQASLDRIQAVDLMLDMVTGGLKAAGPGWFHTTRRGPPPSPVAYTARRPTGLPREDDQSLTYVGVDFQGALVGNLHRREITFVDNVKTVYGPVGSWATVLNPDRPETLGPSGAVLSCNQLTVAEMAVPNRPQRAMELLATGNTLVEAACYTARASRLSYAQTKDLLILEGDGRTDAELFRQERVGAEMSRLGARKIFFWPSTNRLNIDRGTLMEVNESSRPKSGVVVAMPPGRA